VYHGHKATRKLKELARAYETLSIDTQRAMGADQSDLSRSRHWDARPRSVSGETTGAMARLTLARKIAAVALVVWKKGEAFDPKKLDLTT
jgi:hypothetical protein